MKRIKVVNNKNLPSRIPVTGGFMWFLMLERLNAPTWLFGVIGTLYFLLLITSIVGKFMEDQTDIFHESK